MSIYTTNSVPNVALDEALRPFFLAIRERPGDDLPRLVFADWLEENRTDDWAAATVEFIRHSCSSKKSVVMPRGAYKWLRDNWKRLVPGAWHDLANSAADLFEAIDLRRRALFECGEEEINGRIIRFKVWRTSEYTYTRRLNPVDPTTEMSPAITRGHGYRAEIQFKRGFAFVGFAFSPKLTPWAAIVNQSQPFCQWPAVGGFPCMLAAFNSQRSEW